MFVLAAGVCSLLALANAPVGPPTYSPALTGFRSEVADASTVVLGSHELLAEDHGGPYISWELRGGRVCIAEEGELDKPPPGSATWSAKALPKTRRSAGSSSSGSPSPTCSGKSIAPPAGKSPCPLIAVRQARQGPAR